MHSLEPSLELSQLNFIEYTPSSLELMFWHALALIAAACMFTPLFKRVGLGAVLGYLVAGLIVNLLFSGNFSDHPEELLHFSEFGVVLFLFVIGLELKPASLWRMRGDIFGLGSAQLLGCGVVLAGFSLLFGMSIANAAVIGLGLALSSTAIVMSQLDERNERHTAYGRKSFGVLLLQDLAIVPLLLLVSLLASVSNQPSLPDLLRGIAVVLGAIIFLILIGRYGLDRLFALLAKSRMQEIMTAAALGVVIGAALLMDVVGMSYAMGSFLAGVMLAESTFRHEIEANIEPFRGLFLGLFFMAVGLSLNIEIIAQYWYIILAIALLGMIVKAFVIYVLTRFFGNAHNTGVRVALILAQHGEFGFVLFASAATLGLFPSSLSSLLIAIISVSMALSSLTERLESWLLSTEQSSNSVEEDFSDAGGSVLVVGFGRFGQIVSQPLFAHGMDVTILDHDVQRIDDAKRFGFRVHYGDGTRRDILQIAGLASVDAVVICTDNEETTTRIVKETRALNSDIPLFVRAYDRHHVLKLCDQSIDSMVRETFESALLLGQHVLAGVGVRKDEATDIVADVRAKDRARLEKQRREGMYAGNEHLYLNAVKPGPL